MLPFREASKSAVERDFACVDLGKSGAEIYSIHSLQLVLCTSSGPYVLFTVLSFNHQVGNC